MALRKFILICQSGGKFLKSKDGFLSYTGGEAHAIDVNCDTRYEDLKLELADMWNTDIEGASIKYFLPGNKQTLITISNDKDLQRMIDFHGDSTTADIYVVPRDSLDQDSMKKSSGRGNHLVQADSVNHISAPSAAATTAAVLVTSPVGDASPIVTSPSAVAIVATNHPNGIPAFATPIPASTASIPTLTVAVSSSGTSASPSMIAADAIAPTATQGSTKPAATPVTPSTCTSCAIPVDKKIQRRTASWKVGTSGVTIVSVIDGVMQQGCSGSCKKEISGPTTGTPASDFEQQRCTASSGNNLNTASVSDADDVNQQGLIASWKNGITDVGQKFSGAHEFRDVLQKYAIANRFMYKLKKNDTLRVSAKCREEGCSWRIFASWVPRERSFKIKRMNKAHTCGVIRTSIPSQTTKHWLASVVKDKLRDNPHYRPKEIASDICRDFGIELNYYQARSGIEMARKQLQGSYEEIYNLLPGYCEKVLDTNPGSIARFITKDDLSFQRLFISYHASLHGFQNGCRPLLFLEATSLKSRYHEILLAAVAVDGDDGAFPIAFAVVDVEDDDNWHWFLEQLKSVVSNSQSITFISDKQKGLKKLVHEIFENAHSGYCVHYLVEDFKRDNKGPFNGEKKDFLPGNFLAASEAFHPDEFRKFTESIRDVSAGAYEWVLKSEPECWANSLFRGEQYNQIKFDDVVSFKNWMLGVHELPIIQKIDIIRDNMMQLINTRREDSTNWSTKLTPSKEEKLQEESQKSRVLKVLISSTNVFEVHGDCINVVNMDQCECSCRVWKLTGLPCSHAIAVFNFTARNPYDYCSKYFTTESYRLTYSEPINPIPEIGKFDNKESSDKVQVHPPRPRTRSKKRKLTKSEEVNKRSFHCSKCKGVGHSKVTCKITG